jgi:hypothetical protein
MILNLDMPHVPDNSRRSFVKGAAMAIITPMTSPERCSPWA